MGNVLAAGLGQNPARQAAIKAGVPEACIATTVNKVCASGLKAVTLGAQAIMLGLRDVVVAGGMESMSNAPYLLDKHRFGARMGHQQMTDSMLHDGLWDFKGDQHMGMCAELCAETHGISREEQDKYAAMSYARSRDASARDGGLGKEIVPFTVSGRRGSVVVGSDEEPAKNAASAADPSAPETVPAALAKLRTVFKPSGGTVTAGNASPLSDGAAALVLVSREAAEANGWKILAVVRGFDDAAQAPELFTTSPALAVPRAVKRAGLSQADISLYEINEAFSVVALANMKLLDLDSSNVNVLGGAVAIGHPLGCSGARIVVTLCNALALRSERFGVAAVCNGGGGASALVVENVSSS